MRVCGGAGVAGVVLVIAGISAVGDTPDPHDSASSIAAYFVRNQSAIFASSTLVTVGALAIVVFLAAVRERLRDVDAPVLATLTFAAGAGVVALLVLNEMVYVTLAYTRGGTDPATAKSLFTFTIISSTVQAPLCAALFGAVSIGALRHAILPRWFAWTGIVGAVALLPAAVSYGDTGFFYPDVQQQVVGQLFLLWLLIGGILFLRRRWSQPNERRRS
jgi:hypothetical protein